MAELRVVGLEEASPPLCLLWSQPYVPLQLDLREGENVSQLRLVRGSKPGNLLVVGLDATTGALTTVTLEGELVLESAPEFFTRWRGAARARGRTSLDVASWAGARAGVIRDPRAVRVILEGSSLVIVLDEPAPSFGCHALNLSEVLVDPAGRVVGFAFPRLSAEHLARLRAHARPTPADSGAGA